MPIAALPEPIDALLNLPTGSNAMTDLTPSRLGERSDWNLAQLGNPSDQVCPPWPARVQFPSQSEATVLTKLQGLVQAAKRQGLHHSRRSQPKEPAGYRPGGSEVAA